MAFLDCCPCEDCRNLLLYAQLDRLVLASRTGPVRRPKDHPPRSYSTHSGSDGRGNSNEHADGGGQAPGNGGTSVTPRNASSFTKVATSPPTPEGLSESRVTADHAKAVENPESQRLSQAQGRTSSATATKPKRASRLTTIISSPKPDSDSGRVAPETRAAAAATAAAAGGECEERPPLDLDAAFARIRADLIGRLTPVDTPFGSKPLVYADWTASGRPVESIERFMQEEVLPLYGNTHTTSSATGAQTTAFREEARRMVANAVNAKDEDVVLFVGSGSTAAITKIVGAMSFNERQASWLRTSNSKPVVFIGPFEHHSNILPWRESQTDVVQIAENENGELSIEDLQKQLKAYARRRLKIGSFTAASNLTGALEDVAKITKVLHQGGALSFWDYATAAPYVNIDMNPPGSCEGDEALAAVDAVFVSGHKFLGGAGTPGLLICKKKLFRKDAPVVPGGGTVLLVSKDTHAYLDHLEEREEGGTPDILGSIRLGLVYQLKQRLGNVEEREEQLAHLGLSVLRSNSAVVMLGDNGRKRLPIFSFVIRHGKRFLHHNFVCALLNDLFGVQARAGCQCAGPYGISLLGLPDWSLPRFKKQLTEGVGIIKPGFSRLSLTFFMSDAEVNYILDAVLFVADHGAKFLPLYEPCLESGDWRVKSLIRGSLVGVRLSGVNGGGFKKLSEARYGFCEDGHAGSRAGSGTNGGTGNSPKAQAKRDGACAPSGNPGSLMATGAHPRGNAAGGSSEIAMTPTLGGASSVKSPRASSRDDGVGGCSGTGIGSEVARAASVGAAKRSNGRVGFQVEMDSPQLLREESMIFEGCMKEARRFAAMFDKSPSRSGTKNAGLLREEHLIRLGVHGRVKYALPEGAEALRWFHFPGEPIGTMSTAAVIASLAPSSSRTLSKQCIVVPKVYSDPRGWGNPKTLRRGRSADAKPEAVRVLSKTGERRKGWGRRQLSSASIVTWAEEADIGSAARLNMGGVVPSML